MALNFSNGIKPNIGQNIAFGAVKNFFSPSQIRLEKGEAEYAVAEGEYVYIGQPLTKGVSPVFSGISGNISFAENGDIVVTNDFKLRTTDRLVRADKPLSEYTYEELMQLIEYHGVRDTRDGRMLCEILSSCHTPQRLIINCTETDFMSTPVAQYITENLTPLIGGAKILSKLLGVNKLIFVCTENSEKLIELLKKTFGDSHAFVLAVIKAKYPIVPQTVYSALYYKQIPRGKSCEEMGYPIISAESVMQTYTSLVTGIPQVYKLMSVCGEMADKKMNLYVPIGTDIAELFAIAGIKVKEGAVAVSGSVYSGEVLKKDAKVSCTTSQVMALKASYKKPEKCIRCGECINACPMLLNVQKYALSNEARKSGRKYYKYSDICIYCGCCEYVCPSNIPLTDIIRRENALREEGYDK